MIINRNFKNFKFRHRNKENQIIYTSKKVKDDEEIINLIENFLDEKNSFIFESVEKGNIRGRYTIIGLNPDKIWDIKGKIITETFENKKKIIKKKPLIFLNDTIKKFKIKLPNSLPKMASMRDARMRDDGIGRYPTISTSPWVRNGRTRRPSPRPERRLACRACESGAAPRGSRRDPMPSGTFIRSATSRSP